MADSVSLVLGRLDGPMASLLEEPRLSELRSMIFRNDLDGSIISTH